MLSDEYIYEFITIHGCIKCHSYTKESLSGHQYDILTLLDKNGKQICKKMYTCEINSIIVFCS